MKRRDFLPLLAAAAAPSFGRQLKTIGVQLYTVRSVLPKQPLETLQAIEQMGYAEIEAVGASLPQIWESVQKTKLKPVSVHLDTALFTRNQDKLPAALDDAKRKGFRYAVCPYIAPNDRGGVDVIRKLGETLNKAGKLCKDSGMELCYHNHAFEFEPFENGTLLDVLLKTADPKLVSLELDIMWAQVAGLEPANEIKKYGKRVALLHLKNVESGLPKQYNEKVPRTAFKEVGSGAIDIPAVLRAARSAGVKHYFVEQDQTPGDPLASLRQSFDYLKKLDF